MKAGSASFWRDFKRWVPGLLISGVAVFVLLNIASWGDLVKAFSMLKPLNVIVGILLTIASLFTRAIAWRILLQKKVSITQAFLGINIGYLLNNVFPLRAGEIGRAIYIGRISGLGSFQVLSTVIIERAFDVALSAGILLATLPLVLELDWAKPVALTSFVLVLVGMSLLYLLARNTQAVKKWMEAFGSRSDFIKRAVLPRLDSIISGFSIMTNLKQFALSVFWIIVTWGMWLLLYYVMMKPLAPEVQFWWAAFTDGLIAMGIALPSAPGALGIYEAAIVGALGILGIDASTALAYAITMHILQFTVTGIFGLIGVTQAGSTLSGLFSEIRLQKTTNTTH